MRSQVNLARGGIIVVPQLIIPGRVAVEAADKIVLSGHQLAISKFRPEREARAARLVYVDDRTREVYSASAVAMDAATRSLRELKMS